MSRIKYFADWFFRDLRVRKGEYVIGETANVSIIVFTVSLILGLIIYTSWLHKALLILSAAALTFWSIQEIRTGHSRFRKFLGVMGLVALVLAIVFYINL